MLCLQENVVKKVSMESDSPRASTSSSDIDNMSKAKLAAHQDDPFNVSNASVLKETEMTHKDGQDAFGKHV